MSSNGFVTHFCPFTCFIQLEDVHNSWLYCFTNPLELGTRVSLSHVSSKIISNCLLKFEAILCTLTKNY